GADRADQAAVPHPGGLVGHRRHAPLLRAAGPQRSAERTAPPAASHFPPLVSGECCPLHPAGSSGCAVVVPPELLVLLEHRPVRLTRKPRSGSPGPLAPVPGRTSPASGPGSPRNAPTGRGRRREPGSLIFPSEKGEARVFPA